MWLGSALMLPLIVFVETPVLGFESIEFITVSGQLHAWPGASSVCVEEVGQGHQHKASNCGVGLGTLCLNERPGSLLTRPLSPPTSPCF